MILTALSMALGFALMILIGIGIALWYWDVFRLPTDIDEVEE